MQYYGFYTLGDESEVVYDDHYFKLPYFVASHMTVFETNLLSHLTADLLLGQISYQQGADIYNYTHRCEYIKKTTMSQPNNMS